ncbi:MAG TPA: hypothetical protein VFR19_10370 [Hyphomicrobiaceae bacterium]|jgi:hypothetical protein|nr:hypothetical protein [Hyphomicrobiaceae bacterium]
MTGRLGATVLLCLCIGPAPAAADPTGFTCNFASGTAHAYDKGDFIAEKPAPLTFSIGAIDGAAQSAEVRTERGTGSLHLVQAVNATHFLEVVTEGYLNITTVYDKDEATGKYPAVHSRHLGILGQPVITQYQGFCEAKD